MGEPRLLLGMAPYGLIWLVRPAARGFGDVRMAGMLPVVGKIGVSDTILLKPGALTEAETAATLSAYVSDPALFRRMARQVSRHLLLRHGIPATLAEVRIVGGRLPAGRMLSAPRRKMVLGAGFEDYCARLGIDAQPIVVSPVLRRLLYQPMVATQAIPKIALAPLFIVWFGFGMTPKVAVAFLIAFFPIVIDTIVGLRSIDPGIWPVIGLIAFVVAFVLIVIRVMTMKKAERDEAKNLPLDDADEITPTRNNPM